MFLETSWFRWQRSDCKTLRNSVHSGIAWRNSLYVWNSINFIQFAAACWDEEFVKKRSKKVDFFLARPSGTSVDWTMGVQNVPYAYLLEFRDKGAAFQLNCFNVWKFYTVFNSQLSINFWFGILTGRDGFILPAEQIVPNSLEILDGLLAMVREAEN